VIRVLHRERVCDSDNCVAERELPPVVKKLKKWRTKNKLSQRQAVEVMKVRGYPVRLSALQHWEVGLRSPSELVIKALEAFLAQHPTITDAPKFGRWIKPKND